ncbi:hypothetical protein AGMMS4956_05070 [Bacteroidia bacterium]|nr:hypothetical protein AGMMS4956_05070 [Bacteroidia bacterium]
MQLSDGGKVVDYEALKRKCNSVLTEYKFSTNFAQMVCFGKKNHGKVFEKNGDEVRLWEPVERFIKEEFNRTRRIETA